MTYPSIELRTLREWQEITNLIADICHVPSALVMRQNETTMEVMAGSQHPDSPYRARETAPLNGELYCETVIRMQHPLLVPNALKDPEWADNPDVALGMISYYGVPVNWPDGEPFGTLCILDRVEMHPTDQERLLVAKFGKIIEMSLDLTMANRDLEEKNHEIAEAMATIKTISGVVPLCAWCHAAMQDDKGEWLPLEEYIQTHSNASLTHGLCPACQKKLESERRAR